VLTVANAQMADLIRRVTVQRGHDPRDFVLYAFGGAAPQYVGRYAMDLGVRDVVVPAFASVFSAFGAASSDRRTFAELDAPRPFPVDPVWVAAQLSGLEERVREELSLGDSAGEPEVERRLRLRFRQQVHELAMRLPAGEITSEMLEALVGDFSVEYERTFGQGTAYTIAGVELVGLRVEGRHRLNLTPPRREGVTGSAPVGERSAWFEGAWSRVPVWNGADVAGDVDIDGPAFLEFPSTTAVVYPGQSARIDHFGNIFLTRRDAP
jgi:N-methylhydantoinase A